MPSGWEITPAELKAWLEEKRPLFLCDVREVHEFDICRIPGSGLFPLSRFEDVAADIPPGLPVVTICHHGVRSLNAAAFLKQQMGMKEVWSLAGGVERWAREIDPDMPRY